MKRRDLLKAGGFGILAFALRNIPAEGAEGGSGAVRLVLSKRTGGEDPNDAGAGEIVGWAIVNTTAPTGQANRQLHVLVTLDKGDPSAEYDIRVEINGVWRLPDVGPLSTSANGKGSSRLVLNLSDYPGSWPTVDIQVEVGEEGTGFASATTAVPQKRKARKKKKPKKK